MKKKDKIPWNIKLETWYDKRFKPGGSSPISFKELAALSLGAISLGILYYIGSKEDKKK
ncbi:hypothetical protein [Brachyspira hampsonii]|uniref:hypothetical protein n=1 Tax=Brachyspira hampsonii TaxID=1287055 RepID=UPI001CA5A8D2|nr:hypothetical protein [Brachyspira hampsonii]